MKKPTDACIFCAPSPCECAPKKKTANKRPPKPAGGVETRNLAAATPPPAAPKVDVRAAMKAAVKEEVKEEYEEDLVIALANLSPILAPSELKKHETILATPLARKIKWRNAHANPAVHRS